jgi:UTP-glucose-1-phosphate uridylyltransferase
MSISVDSIGEETVEAQQIHEHIIFERTNRKAMPSRLVILGRFAFIPRSFRCLVAVPSETLK